MTVNPTAKHLFIVEIILIVSFGIYFFLLVPTFESPIPQIQVSHEEPSQKMFESAFAQYLGKDAWECDSNISTQIKSRNTVMFFKNVKLYPQKAKSEECTILIAPNEETFPMVQTNGKKFHPICIQVLKGTEVEISMDKNSNLKSIVGKMLGPVKISYQMELNGHTIDCMMLTSNLNCDMKTLQSSEKVKFMFGPFFAEGDHLKVVLDSKLEEKQFQGIRSIELENLDYMTLKLNRFFFQQMGIKLSPKMSEQILKKFGNKIEIPITLKCEGSVSYDVSENVIRFSDNVTLECLYPSESPDKLSCGQLELQLTDEIGKRLLNMGMNSSREKDVEEEISEDTTREEEKNPVVKTEKESVKNPSSSENAMKDLPLDVIKAKHKVMLLLPTFKSRVETENLIFHTANQQLELSGDTQSAIYFDRHEFHAFNISYTIPPQNSNKLGRIEVNKGSGWMETTFNQVNTPEVANLRLHWDNNMIGEPMEDGRYVLNVAGNVRASTSLGTLDADFFKVLLRPRTLEDDKKDMNLALELHEPLLSPDGKSLYGNEASSSGFLPESVTAEGNIKLDARTEQLNLEANLDKIHFDFQKPEQVPQVFLQAKQNQMRKKAQRKNTAPTSPYVPNTIENQETDSPRSFVLSAGTLTGNIQLMPGKNGVFVQNATMVGQNEKNISLYEKTPMFLEEQKISFEAQRIILHDVLPEMLQCEVIGLPARVSGKGIILKCSKIALNCAANRIVTADGGEMHVFFRRKSESPMVNSQLIDTRISWDKNLSFDGKKINVQNNVQIKMDQTEMHAELLSATLREKIRFCDPPKFSKDDQRALRTMWESVNVEQNVTVNHLKYNPNGQLTDVASLEAQSANFFPETMEVQILRKGFIRYSFYGETKNLIKKAENTDENFTPESTGNGLLINPQEKENQEWSQILCEFSTGASGNFLNGEIYAQGKISALFSPVPGPGYKIQQTDVKQEDIPERGFQFSCDEITISKLPAFDPNSMKIYDLNKNVVEFIGKGNLNIKNQIVHVMGSTLKYTQDKSLCYIEGEPAKPLKIFGQQFIAGPRDEFQANTAIINVKTGEVKTDGAGLESNLRQ